MVTLEREPDTIPHREAGQTGSRCTCGMLPQIVGDYDRRRTHWWGRLLLWLLRHTT